MAGWPPKKKPNVKSASWPAKRHHKSVWSLKRVANVIRHLGGFYLNHYRWSQTTVTFKYENPLLEFQMKKKINQTFAWQNIYSSHSLYKQVCQSPTLATEQWTTLKVHSDHYTCINIELIRYNQAKIVKTCPSWLMLSAQILQIVFDDNYIKHNPPPSPLLHITGKNE